MKLQHAVFFIALLAVTANAVAQEKAVKRSKAETRAIKRVAFLTFSGSLGRNRKGRLQLRGDCPDSSAHLGHVRAPRLLN